MVQVPVPAWRVTVHVTEPACTVTVSPFGTASPSPVVTVNRVESIRYGSVGPPIDGVQINPREWWDEHWIHDRIMSKL